MRILNVASLSPEGVARHRIDSMRRLGHQVEVLDTDEYTGTGSRIARWLRYRTLIGPTIRRFNRRLAALAEAGNFDLIWLDKPVYVWPETVRALRRTGAFAVSYNPDNPYGSRRDLGWRLFLKCLPEFDLHVVPRPSNVSEYRDAGAAQVLVMPFSFEPAQQFPPPAGWSDADRSFDVGFVGTPYDDRADFIRELWRRHHIMARIRGPRWEHALTADEQKLFCEGGAVYGDGYREAIWRTKINLGFVTRANRDTYAHRWFEITGCGGFLLAERTEDGLQTFDDRKEAVFFNGVDECAELIRRYLPDVEARMRIARAGHARAVASGYDNDSRLQRVFDKIATACRN